MLPIPENYYEDLETETDLRAEQVTPFHAHNILHGRDDQRFFFEIVERRQYKGYPAASAPVRLAAQSRLT